MNVVFLLFMKNICFFYIMWLVQMLLMSWLDAKMPVSVHAIPLNFSELFSAYT